MSKNNNNNIIIHDFTQRLNFYAKNNIFSGYLYEQNKSTNLRYQKEDLNNKDNKSLKKSSDKNFINLKHRQAQSMPRSTPKYLYPSMENNLLCENLFQRKSHLLPEIQKNAKLFKTRYQKNNDITSRSNEKRRNKRKTVFLSTTSFDIKKLENAKQRNLFNSNKKQIINIMNSKHKNIKLFNNNNFINNSLYKVNWNKSKIKKDPFYYYIIRPENCGYLVKKCFKHRKNWKEIENLESKKFNFKWQQNNYGINFNLLSINPDLKQLVNHFEYKNVISNKANLFLNMMEFAEMQEINIFKYVPFTVLFDYNKVNFFNKIIKFEHLFKNITEYIVPTYEINERKYKKNKERIYGSFFPLLDKVGNKTAINIPETHFVPKKIIFETNNDVSNNNNNKNIKGKNNYWLIKAPDLNRGRCIKILNSLIDIKTSIREFSMGIKLGYLNSEKYALSEEFDDNYYFSNQYNYNYYNNEDQKIFYNNYNEINDENLSLLLKEKDFSPHKENSSNHYRSNMIIVQKYIENPLLYFGRKFDIRIWALLTNDLKIYVFEEGHLKCCSINYDLNSENTFCHLTNYSFQKYNSNFGKYEHGNEASFDDLQKNIEVNYENKVNFKNDIFPKIKQIIQFVFESVKYKINPLERKYSFEIFGFDFMLDCDFDPFLIEVNTNPGLEESSPLIKMLVPRMIDDALRLTLDKEFDTVYNFGEDYKYSSLYESPFPVKGYSNNENMFKFIGDLYNDPNCDVYRSHLTSSKAFFFRNNNNKI